MKMKEYKDIEEWLQEQTGELDILDYFYEGLQEREAEEMKHLEKINIGTEETPKYISIAELEQYLE